MKFKVDENLGLREIQLLRSAGHDVLGVRDQGLSGTADERIFAVCGSESRALITLDRELWIVEPGRVRVHDHGDPPTSS